MMKDRDAEIEKNRNIVIQKGSAASLIPCVNIFFKTDSRLKFCGYKIIF